MVAAIAEEDLAEAVEVLAAVDGDPHRLAARLLDGFLTCHTAAKTGLWLEILAEAARNPKIAAIMRETERRIRTHMRLALLRSCRGCPEADAAAMDVRIDTVLALMEGVNLRRFKQGAELSPAQVRAVQATLAVVLATPLDPAASLDHAPALDAEQVERQRHARVNHNL